MTTYTIEKNVPIPITKGYGKNKVPFLEMEVGDSIVFEGDIKEVGSALNTAYYVAKHTHNFKIKYRTIYDNDGNKSGVRIWRVRKET